MKKSDYKLDFSYTHNGVKYTLKKCSTISTSSGLHNRSYSLLTGIYCDYKQANRVSELAQYVTVDMLFGDYDRPEEKAAAIKIIMDGGIDNINHLTDYSKDYPYSIPSVYRRAVEIAIRKTPEYALAEESFQKWLKERPGVRNSWVEYARKYNAKHNAYSYKVEPDLDTMSNGINVAGFRRLIECNRPDKFLAGQVVRLKEEYRNKRGKDPFYYRYSVDRDADRVGTVLKKEGISSMVNYGEGAREIRVLWFITGEESHVPEKCLKLE